jgi:hypothetical protein
LKNWAGLYDTEGKSEISNGAEQLMKKAEDYVKRQKEVHGARSMRGDLLIADH